MNLKLAVHKKAITNTIKPHILHYTEVTLVLSGCMEYGEGSHRLPLEAGDILYLKEGSFRSCKQGSGIAE